MLLRAAYGQENLPAPTPIPAVKAMTLDRATGLALGNSPVLRQAVARVEQAQGTWVQVGLYPNPIQNSGNPHQLGGNNSLYSAGVSQEIVRGGKLQLNRAAAEQAVREANLDLIHTRFELLTAVRQQFFVILALQNRMATLQDLQQTAQQSVDTAEKLYRAQQGTTTDVKLLRIELRRIEVLLRSTEYNRAAANSQLSALLGLPNLPIEGVAGDLKLELPNYDDPTVRGELLARSSLMEAARTEILRTQFMLRRAEVEPTPNVILNGGYQWSVSQPHSQALVGLYFTIPIWDRNQGNIRAAQANVRQSVAQLSTVQNDLLRQLAEALGRYRSAQVTVELYEGGILRDAEESLESMRRLLKEGQLNRVQVLQTQRMVFEANLDYIAAQQERLAAGAAIAGLLQLDRFP
jgi:cobalt-zinc-cadmium efflux system outer membrane protein